MNPSRLAYLDSFRAVAVAMVVAVHVFGYVKFGSQEMSDLIWFIIDSIAVPVFFLVDGFLFSMKQMENHTFEYKVYIRTSARRLLVPWVVFSLAYAIFRWGIEIAGFTTEKIIIGATTPQLFLQIYTSGVAPQMYFLLSLFLVRTLALLNRGLVVAPAWIVILSFACYTAFYRGFFHDEYRSVIPLPGLDPVQHAFWGLQYYLLGIVLFKLRVQLTKYAPVIAGGTFVLVVGFRLTMHTASFLSQYAYLIFAFCFFMTISRRENVLSAAGMHTMGIYLFHNPVLLGGILVVGRLITHDPLTLFMMVWACTFLSAWTVATMVQAVPLGNWMLGGVPVRKLSG
jgi:surface polysaccharide O-acyltransferase-like enzyme